MTPFIFKADVKSYSANESAGIWMNNFICRQKKPFCPFPILSILYTE